MADNQKGFFIFFCATLALLSCCSPVSSFFIPRVTRTDDAIIIDFAVSALSARYQGKNYRGIAVNPSTGFQQQGKFPNGWFYSYGHSSVLTPGRVLSEKQLDEDQTVKLGFGNATQCGRGPTTFPTSRSSVDKSRTATDKNVWPFVVTVASYFEGVVCAGSLISDSKVLLASQCLQRMSLSEMSFLTVMIGMKLNDVSGAQITRRVSKIVLHSKFNAMYYANDIAIITLDAPVTFSRIVAPVCLPSASTDPDQYADEDAIVLGWSGTSSDTPAPFLDNGKVTILSNDDCKLIKYIGQYVTDTTICTSPDAKFSCTGDVGGPVVVMSSPGTWTVIGINSYYKDCTSNGLDTSVSAFRDWIDKYMKV